MGSSVGKPGFTQRPGFPEGLFFFSGSSALIYEVLWTRQLGLVFGTTTQAVSTVLAAYMLGLALGAFVGGRWADRARNPLRLYGLLELGIGAAGLALSVLIARLSGLRLPAAGGGAMLGIALVLLRFGIGFGLLLVPTLLMGATFPALVRVLDSAGAGQLGRLYAANTLGAVAGTLLAGYAFIARFGVSGTAALAALINFGVAWIALIKSGPNMVGGSRQPVTGGLEPQGRLLEPRVSRPLALTLLAFSGATTLGTEILWTRVLLFPLLSTTYAFASVLASFLAGLASGGALTAWRLAKARRPWFVLAWLQALLGLALLVPVAATGPIDTAFKAVQAWTVGHQTLSIVLHISLIFVLLLPQTLLAGAAYPLLLRAGASETERMGIGVGRGLFLNTLGATVGAAVVAPWVIPTFGILPAFAAFAVLWFGAGIVLGFRGRDNSWTAATVWGTAAALVLAALAWGPLSESRQNPFETLDDVYGPRPRVVAYREGAESTLTVVEAEGGLRALRINGFEAAGVRGDLYGYMRLMAHLPLLLHGNPKEALVISFGTGTTAAAAARHRLTRLDLVDLDPEVFKLADTFAAVNRGVLNDQRVHAFVNDGRNFLALTERRYDVITLEPMPPTFAGMVNLYSREFYSSARAHLRADGLVCQWVPFHLMSLKESESVLRTFLEVFPQSSLWMYRGSGFVIGTAGQRLTVDAERLEAGLNDANIQKDLASIGVGELIPLLNLLVSSPESLRALTASALVVTDDFPILDFPEVPFRVGPRSTLSAVRVWQAQETIYDRRRADHLPIVNLPAALEVALAESNRDYDEATVGGAALELGHLDLAETMFRARAARCQTDQCRAQVAYRMGLLAERRGDLPAARRYLREADRLEPGRTILRDALRRLQGESPP